MAKNQKNPKKKKKASVVIFVIELIALLVLVAGIFVYARINDGLRNLGTSSALNQTTGTGTVAGQISQADGTVIAETADNQAAAPADVTADPNFDGDAAEENAEIAQNSSLKGYTNIALVGIDTRDNSGIDYANSDTMIIASINNDTGQIRMVSIYRDTLLNIGKNLTYNVKQGDYDEDDAAFDIVEDYGDDNGGDYDDGGDDDGGYDDFDGGDDVPSDNGGDDYGGDSPSDNGDNGGSPSDNGDNGGSPSDNGDTPTDNDNGIVDTGNETPDNTGDNTPDVYVDDNTRTEEDDIYKNNDNYNSDSDVTLPDAVSYQLGDTKAEGNYDKSNAAYQNGSAKQLLSMLNKNLDLNIHEYVVVDFMAVAKLIDDLDGIEVWMTKQEVIHMNNYCKETSKVTGLSYEEIVPSEEAANYQLNGVQAVSYARIRYTTGNDMKRTQRQRVVIQKIASKAQAYGLKTVQAMITDVFPYCKTSLSPAEIISMATAMFNYNIEKTTGFPFEHLEKKVYVGTRSLDCVVPVTLETNVQQLHEFLFDEQNYQVSETVKLYSQDIQTLTNLTENNIESAKKNSVIGSSGGEADIVK